ncbi:MAG: hypothetical protein WC749_06620 [Dehalococcoidia bacterium]
MKLEELETGVVALPEGEYRQFRHWFLERDWERWDKEIGEDSESGKLDFLIEGATDAKRGKRLKAL